MAKHSRLAVMLIIFTQLCVSASILLHGPGAVNGSLTFLEERMTAMEARLESLESRCRKII